MTTLGMRSLWAGLLASVAAAAAVGAVSLTSSEQVLRSSFSAALGNVQVPLKTEASAVPVSGSEEFWLSSMPRDGLSPAMKKVSIGDHIAFSLGGERHTLEVSKVAEIAPQITQVDTSSGPGRLVLVTARDVDDVSARPVHFVMEIDQGAAPVVAGRTGRTS